MVGDDGGDEGATERLVKDGVFDFELADLAVERLVFDAVNAEVDFVFVWGAVYDGGAEPCVVWSVIMVEEGEGA